MIEQHIQAIKRRIDDNYSALEKAIKQIDSQGAISYDPPSDELILNLVFGIRNPADRSSRVILGVEPPKSSNELKRLQRDLALSLHPDKKANNDELKSKAIIDEQVLEKILNAVTNIIIQEIEKLKPKAKKSWTDVLQQTLHIEVPKDRFLAPTPQQFFAVFKGALLQYTTDVEFSFNAKSAKTIVPQTITTRIELKTNNESLKSSKLLISRIEEFFNSHKNNGSLLLNNTNSIRKYLEDNKSLAYSDDPKLEASIKSLESIYNIMSAISRHFFKTETSSFGVEALDETDIHTISLLLNYFDYLKHHSTANTPEHHCLLFIQNLFEMFFPLEVCITTIQDWFNQKLGSTIKQIQEGLPNFKAKLALLVIFNGKEAAITSRDIIKSFLKIPGNFLALAANLSAVFPGNFNYEQIKADLLELLTKGNNSIEKEIEASITQPKISQHFNEYASTDPETPNILHSEVDVSQILFLTYPNENNNNSESQINQPDPSLSDLSVSQDNLQKEPTSSTNTSTANSAETYEPNSADEIKDLPSTSSVNSTSLIASQPDTKQNSAEIIGSDDSSSASSSETDSAGSSFRSDETKPKPTTEVVNLSGSKKDLNLSPELTNKIKSAIKSAVSAKTKARTPQDDIINFIHNTIVILLTKVDRLEKNFDLPSVLDYKKELKISDNLSALTGSQKAKADTFRSTAQSLVDLLTRIVDNKLAVDDTLDNLNQTFKDNLEKLGTDLNAKGGFARFKATVTDHLKRFISQFTEFNPYDDLSSQGTIQMITRAAQKQFFFAYTPKPFVSSVPDEVKEVAAGMK